MRGWPAKSTAALMLLVSLVIPVRAQTEASRADADRMNKKVQAIMARSVDPAPLAKPLTTSFTEAELNAYLRLDPTAELPVGMKQPVVLLLDGGRVDSKALIDLDMIRTSEKRGWLDPLSYVTGTLEVRTVGVFSGSNGKGVYQFESASVGGVPVSKSVLQELLAFYTRTPETPKGIPLDAPFELPARIRDVQLRRGMGTVTQ